MHYSKPAEILLVDHIPDSIELVNDALNSQKRKAHLHVVENGDDALDYLFKRGEHADAQRPDIILLDLPGAGGREMLAEAKANFSLCDIPIIAFTSAATPEEVLDAWNLHVNCYLHKPENLKDCTNRLASVLNFWLNVARLPSAITTH